VVELLRVAAGDGRLTAAELDERLDAALTARTSGKLAVLTADLPEVTGQAGGTAERPKDVVRYCCVSRDNDEMRLWIARSSDA
jgi:hypothetical protein